MNFCSQIVFLQELFIPQTILCRTDTWSSKQGNNFFALIWLLGPKLAENSSGSDRSRWQGMEVMWAEQDNSSMSCHPLAAFLTHSNSAAIGTWALPLEHMVPEPFPLCLCTIYLLSTLNIIPNRLLNITHQTGTGCWLQLLEEME